MWNLISKIFERIDSSIIMKGFFWKKNWHCLKKSGLRIIVNISLFSHIYLLWLTRVAIFVYLSNQRKWRGDKRISIWLNKPPYIFSIFFEFRKIKRPCYVPFKVTKLAILSSNLETIRKFSLDVLLCSKKEWCILVVVTIKDKWVN